jgi:hypothetical protein
MPAWLAASAIACSKSSPNEPSDAFTNDFQLVFAPPSVALTAPDQQATVALTGDETSGAPVKPADVSLSPYHGPDDIFTVSTPAIVAGGISVTLTATGVGTSKLVMFPLTGAPLRDPLQIQDAAVTVYPGGAWSGSVSLTATTCVPPGQGAYNETLVIAVNSSGTGSATAMDTPGFNRQYPVTFGSTWFNGSAATATGAFSYNGLSVTGAIGIGLTGPNTIDYTETTTYPCSATYHGVLTRKP